VLRDLGVPTELGTDTAWTFEPHPAAYGEEALRKLGWDGSTPVLVVCPINPFEWPVKASVGKFALRSLTGAYKESHYRSVYFHNRGAAADRAYAHYLTSIGNAVDAFRSRHSRSSSSWPLPSGWTRARRGAYRSGWAGSRY
jgi:hypothetical protein